MTKADDTFIPKLTQPDQAVVYLYRPLIMSNAAYSPDLYVNDEFRLSIKNSKNTRLVFTPGEYQFDLEPEENYAGITQLSLSLKAGDTYYIRIDSSLEIKNSVKYEPYQRSFNMIKVESKEAIQQISECCASTKNKNDRSPEEKLLETKDNDGFSVDKTQNPFSH